MFLNLSLLKTLLISFLLLQIVLVNQHVEWSKVEEETNIEHSNNLGNKSEDQKERVILWHFSGNV